SPGRRISPFAHPSGSMTPPGTAPAIDSLESPMGRILISMSALGLTFAANGAGADTGRVPFPHPLISEVLYAVPSGERGDANADGKRDAVGDEFIELVNPHDRPIQLKGYTLMDADAYAPGAAKPDASPPPKPSDKDKPSPPPGDHAKPQQDKARAEL